jgi:hypothetical protein
MKMPEVDDMKRPCNWIALALVAGSLAACGTQPATPGVPAAVSAGEADGTANSFGPGTVIDELAYKKQLIDRRPALFNSDQCARALVLMPALRARLLGGSESPDEIANALYTDDHKALDAAWIDSQQRAEQIYCDEHPTGGCKNICKPGDPCAACAGWTVPTPAPAPDLQVSGYGLCADVGYHLGSGAPIQDPDGIHDWKVFFQLRDFRHDVTAARYQEYLRQLVESYGFVGGSKMGTSLGDERFHYNQIIIYGHTHADAHLAEQAGRDFFGDAIVGHGRGFDITVPGESELDWHHYLCAHDPLSGPTRLRDEAIAYLTYMD